MGAREPKREELPHEVGLVVLPHGADAGAGLEARRPRPPATPAHADSGMERRRSPALPACSTAPPDRGAGLALVHVNHVVLPERPMDMFRMEMRLSS